MKRSIRGRGAPGRLALLTILIALLVPTLGVAQASAADILILDTTVSGGASSVEAQQAASLGLTVDVVNAATWSTLTTAQFASYKAIVLGDPTCGGSPAPYLTPAEANRTVWSPAVTGNVIVNGTDPVYHSGSQPGAVTLINRSINFAAAEPGKTGLYVSLSCYYYAAPPDTPVVVLDQFGPFSVVGQGGCPADSHIVATHPALAGLTDADLSNWGCSTHEGFMPNSIPVSFEVLAISTDIPSTYVAPDGTTGAPYIVARGVEVISDIKLAPETATNPVGSEHCLTATVTEGGSPTPGKTVTFNVISGPNTGVTGTAVTDGSGEAMFCYTGLVAGTDVIEATFVDSAGRTQRSNRVEKIWEETGGPPTITLSPPTATNTVGQQHCVTATVKDSFGNPTPGISVVFTVSGANNRGPTSSTTDSSGEAQFCYTGTNAGNDTIGAFADTNGNGTDDGASDPDDTASKTYTAAAPDTITLSPPTATNTAGQQHCVTATVKDSFGNPTPGISVVFTVSGANNRGPTSSTTDSSGEAQFCYTGTNAGNDTIGAFADTNTNGTDDGASDPDGTATKTYTAAAPATLTLSPKTATNKAGVKHCVTATVKDAFGNPVPGVSVVFKVTGANNRGPTALTTNSNGNATFCYTGTHAGVDMIKAFADTNHNGTDDGASDPDDTASKTYTAAAPATLTLSPKTASNPVDSQHCVTATNKDAFGNPTPGITDRFSVTGSVTTSGSQTTNTSGKATFCYTGPALPGSDAIKAYADTNKNNTQNAGEPSDTATKTWTLPTSVTPCDIKITNGGWIVTNAGDQGSFGGNATETTTGTDSGQVEYQDHGPAQPLNVHSLSVRAITCNPTLTSASIFGKATIDGSGSHWYRVDVEDLAEPGTGIDTYRIRLDTGYNSGKHKLKGGNIQIH